MGSRKPIATQRQINLNTMGVNELYNLQQQLENDCQSLAARQVVLEKVHKQYVGSGESVNKLRKTQIGQATLVPLTSSLYVKGEVANTESVLVDIGTGYLVQMDGDQAAAYYERKAKYLKEKIDEIARIYRDQQAALLAVQDHLQSKVQEQRHQQQQGQGVPPDSS